MQTLDKILGITHPIIMAPMFLVTNVNMMVASLNAGITGCLPAHNFRTMDDFEKALREIKQREKGPFGVNLIVNRSNIFLKKQIDVLKRVPVNFVITSLGSPKDVIGVLKPLGVKIFCDVTNVDYAKQVEQMGADAVIAVNNQAGGHRGDLSPENLLSSLQQAINIPIISAGGVGDYVSLTKMLSLGACGVSVGTIFIPTEESPVSLDYKMACVFYGPNDIVDTNKLSGTWCTVINTPYVREIGTRQNKLEEFLNKYRFLKKYIKMFTMYRGLKVLEKSAFSATYQSVWVAGPSITYVDRIKKLSEVVKSLVDK